MSPVAACCNAFGPLCQRSFAGAEDPVFMIRGRFQRSFGVHHKLPQGLEPFSSPHHWLTKSSQGHRGRSSVRILSHHDFTWYSNIQMFAMVYQEMPRWLFHHRSLYFVMSGIPSSYNLSTYLCLIHSSPRSPLF